MSRSAANSIPAGTKPPPPKAEATAPGLDSARHAKSQEIAAGADKVKRGIAPAMVTLAIGIDEYAPIESINEYVRQILASEGIADSWSRMIAEQALVAHFRSLQLHMLAAKSSPQVNALLTASAAKLVAEQRKLIETLRAISTAASTTKTKRKYAVVGGDK